MYEQNNGCNSFNGCLLESVLGSAFLEFFLVLGSGVRVVFRLGVFARKGSAAPVGAEELGGGFVATDFHDPKLIPLPFWEDGSLSVTTYRIHTRRRRGRRTYDRGW